MFLSHYLKDIRQGVDSRFANIPRKKDLRDDRQTKS